VTGSHIFVNNSEYKAVLWAASAAAAGQANLIWAKRMYSALPWLRSQAIKLANCRLSPSFFRIAGSYHSSPNAMLLIWADSLFSKIEEGKATLIATLYLARTIRRSGEPIRSSLLIPPSGQAQ
jgi:hypothetical protein